MITSPEKPLKQVYLDIVINMILDNGERKALLSVSEDRYLCQALGVDYCAEDLYTQIKGMINDYKREHKSL